MKSFKEILTEGKAQSSDKSNAKAIIKSIPELKGVQTIDSKRTVVFKFKEGLDENNFDNFNKIDAVIAFLEKKYPGSIVEHDFNQFTVKEL